MKRGLLYVLVCTLLVAVAFAQPVEVGHDNVKSSIYPGEAGRYTITVQNNQEFDDTFYVSLDDIRFSPTLIPITDFTGGIKVPAKGRATSELVVVPTENLRIGEYNIRLDLFSRQTDTVHSDVLTLYVAPQLDVYLTPNVTVRFDMPTDLDPRQKFNVDVFASNNNKLDLGDMLVTVKSGLFQREQTISLPPFGSDSVTFQFALDPLQSPREDFVVATVSKDNKIVAIAEKDLRVIEYSPSFTKQYKESSRFLKKSTDILLVSQGNVLRTEALKVSMPWYQRMFSESATAHDTVRDADGVYWVFDVSLQPAGQATVSITTSYRAPFLLLIILLIAGVFYWILRTPIIIQKQAKIVKRTEGGISQLKIYLHIVNRSSSVYEDVRVVDKVSNIARVINEKVMGTLQPSKMVRKGQFSFVEWTIPKLEPGEERLIHYKIESRLSILGDFKLKKAMVEYKKDDVASSSYSNEFFIDVDTKPLPRKRPVQKKRRPVKKRPVRRRR